MDLSREKSCERKTAYETRRRALNVLDKRRLRSKLCAEAMEDFATSGYDRADVYRCAFCQCWHIGRKPFALLRG